jgi:hypothetical protein
MNYLLWGLGISAGMLFTVWGVLGVLLALEKRDRRQWEAEAFARDMAALRRAAEEAIHRDRTNS